MIVMNDRSEAGSAYKYGRIELLINRRGYSEDHLGNPETMVEYDQNGEGINVEAKYYLSFTKSRQDAFSLI